MPQLRFDRVTVGGNLFGTTSSFAQDSNQLKIPSYATVNAFVDFRPVARVELSVRANNLFDTLGIVEVTQASIPTAGIVNVRTIPGRTVSASVKYSF